MDAPHVVLEPAILYLGTPVVLISTVNEDDSHNLAPMSSAFWLGWRCMLGLDASFEDDGKYAAHRRSGAQSTVPKRGRCGQPSGADHPAPIPSRPENFFVATHMNHGSSQPPALRP